MIEITPKLLSILICTRNRRALLTQALESLTRCRIPSGWTVELIVVDNGSTDNTGEAVAAIAPRLPFPVRGVAEPQPGLGRAHATGLQACRGEFVACTDDDCLVVPEWCEAIVAAFSERPELGGVFGRVLPLEDADDSPWRVAVKTQETPATYRFPCWPIIGFGNNMAFRRIALESAGGFNPLFGPGGALWSAEELEVTYRLLRGGWTIAYEPSVQLWHRARTTFKGWASTHVRDALGFGAFTGAYAARGDWFALKLAMWEWQGVLEAWWRGVCRRDTARRQVGGWFSRWLPVGFIVGFWHGVRRHPAPPPSHTVILHSADDAGPRAPKVSVVICTRNRPAQLREALQSVTHGAGIAPSAYELIVVDNGSRGDTRVVVESLQPQAGCRLIYLYEPRRGVSTARNAGLAVARGEFVAFTDDDCVVADDWLRGVVDVLEEDRELQGVFGRVLPLDGAVTSAVVSVKTEESGKRFRFPCSPFIGHGNNMAFRRQTLMEIGGFDIALGAGAPLRAAEDFDLGYRLLRRGHALAYDPTCTVYHRSRATAAEAQATEWRNAVGLGACLGNHILHRDFYAVKCAYWLLSTLPLSALRELWRGERQHLKKRWLFFIGVPYGVLKRCLYAMGRTRAGALSHG